MQIFIRTHTGKLITLDVEQNEKVKDIKNQIEEKVGHIIAGMSRLMFSGRQLLDSKTLDCYDIEKESTLDFSVCANGGIIEPSMRVLAQKYNCDTAVCRKLPPRATNCRKKKCGHCSDIRPKKKLK